MVYQNPYGVALGKSAQIASQKNSEGMKPGTFDRILNPTLGMLQQPIWRVWRALKEDDVDLFSKEGIWDPALLPVLGMFFNHDNDVMPDWAAEQVFGKENKDSFASQFAVSVLTDPLSFLTSGLSSTAKGGRAVNTALTGGAKVATKKAIKEGAKKGIKKADIVPVDDTTSVFHRVANLGSENFDAVINPKTGLKSTDDIMKGTTLRQFQGSMQHALDNGRFLDPTGAQLGESLTKAELSSLGALKKTLGEVSDDFLDKPLQSLSNQAKKREMGLGLPVFGDFMGMYQVAPEYFRKHGSWMNWYFNTARATYAKPAKITMRVVDPILGSTKALSPLYKTSKLTQKALADFGQGWTKGAQANVVAKYLADGEVNALSAEEFLKVDGPIAERIAESAHVQLKDRGLVNYADHRVPVQDHAALLTDQLVAEAAKLDIPFETVVARRFGAEASELLGVGKAADAPEVFKAEITDMLQKREWKTLEQPGYTLELETNRAAVTSYAFQKGRSLKQFFTKLFNNDQGIEGAAAFRTFWNTLESSSSQQTELLGTRMFAKMGELAEASGKDPELLNQMVSSVLALKIDRRELTSFFNFLDRPDMPLKLWHKEYQEFFGGRMNGEIDFLKGVVSQNVDDIPALQDMLDALSVPVARVPQEVFDVAEVAEIAMLNKMHRGLPVDDAVKKALIKKYNLEETKVLYTEAYSSGLELPNLGLVDPKNPGSGVTTIIQANLPPRALKLGHEMFRDTPLASLDSAAVKDTAKQLAERNKVLQLEMEELVEDAPKFLALKEQSEIIAADLNALKNMRAEIESGLEYRVAAADTIDRGKLLPTYEKKVNFLARESGTGKGLGLEEITKAFGDDVADLDDLASVYSRIQFRHAALDQYVKLQGTGSEVFGMPRDIPEAFIEGFMEDVDILGGMLKEAIIKPLSVTADGAGNHTVAHELFDLLDEVRNVTLNAMNSNNLGGAYALPLGYLQRATSGKEFKAIQVALADTIDAVPGLQGSVSAKLANTRLNRSYTLEDLNALATDLASVEHAHPSVRPVMELIQDQRAILQNGDTTVKAYSVDPIASILAHTSEVQEAIGQRKWFEFIKENGGKHGISSMRVTDVIVETASRTKVFAPGTKVKLFTRTVDDAGNYQYPGAKVRFVDDVKGGKYVKGGELGFGSEDGSDILVSKDNKLLKQTLDWLHSASQPGTVGMLSAAYSDGSRATFSPGLLDAIKTTEDLQDFVLAHELSHNIIKRAAGETQGSWETRVNNFAMRQMGIDVGSNAAASEVLKGIRVKPGERVLFDTLIPENFWVGDGHVYLGGATEARATIEALYKTNQINEAGVLMMREAFRSNPAAFKDADSMIDRTSAVLSQMRANSATLKGGEAVADLQAEQAVSYMGALAGMSLKNMASGEEMQLAKTLLLDKVGEKGFIDWAMTNFSVTEDIAKAAMRNQDDFLSIVASSAITKVGASALEEAGLGSIVKEFTNYFRNLWNTIIEKFTSGRVADIDPQAHARLAEQLEGMVTGALQLNKDSAALALSNKARRGVTEFVLDSYKNGLSSTVKRQLQKLGMADGLDAYAEKTFKTRRDLVKQNLDLARVAATLGPEGESLIRKILDADMSLPKMNLQEANALSGLTVPTPWSLVDGLDRFEDDLADLVTRSGGSVGLQEIIELVTDMSPSSARSIALGLPTSESSLLGGQAAKNRILKGRSIGEVRGTVGEGVDRASDTIEELTEQIAKATGKTLSVDEVKELATSPAPARREFLLAGGLTEEEVNVINNTLFQKGAGAYRLRTQSAGELGIGPKDSKSVHSQLEFLLDKGVEGLPTSDEVFQQMRVFDAMLDSETSAFTASSYALERATAKVASATIKTGKRKQIQAGMSAKEVAAVKAHNARIADTVTQPAIDTTRFTWNPPVMSPAHGLSSQGEWAVVSPSIGAKVKNTQLPVTKETPQTPVYEIIDGKRVKVGTEPVMTPPKDEHVAAVQAEVAEVNRLWNSVTDAAKERVEYIRNLETKVEAARTTYLDKMADDYATQVRSQLDDQIKSTSKIIKMLDADSAVASRADIHSFLAHSKLSVPDLRRLARKVGVELTEKDASAIQKKFYAFLGDAQDELMDAVPGSQNAHKLKMLREDLAAAGGDEVLRGKLQSQIDQLTGATPKATGGFDIDVTAAPDLIKGPIKAGMANKYIGFGEGSTGRYRRNAESQGIPTNSGNYSAGDTVFLSVNGRGKLTHENLKSTANEAKKALESGAEVLADLKPTSYNIGEKQLADILKEEGYVLSAVDEANNVGKWSNPKATSGPLEQGTLFDKRGKLKTELINHEARFLDALVGDADELRNFIKGGNLTKDLDFPTRRVLDTLLSERITKLSGIVHAARAAKHGFTKKKVLKDFLGGSEQQVLDEGRTLIRELEKDSHAGLEAMFTTAGVPTVKGAKRLAEKSTKRAASLRQRFQDKVDAASKSAEASFLRRIKENPDIPTEDAIFMSNALKQGVRRDVQGNLTQPPGEYSMYDNGWSMPEEYAYLAANQGRKTAGEAFQIPAGQRGPNIPTDSGGNVQKSYFGTAPEERVINTAKFHVVGEVDGKKVKIPGEFFTQAKLNINSVGHGDDLGAAIKNRTQRGAKISLSGDEVTPEALGSMLGHQVTIGPEGFNNALQQQMKLDVPSNWAAGVKFYDQVHTLTKLFATSLRAPFDFHATQVINAIPQGILEQVGPAAMIQGMMATARVGTKDAYDVMGLDKISSLIQSGKINPAARKQKYPKVIGGTIREMIATAQGRSGRLDLGEIAVEHEDMLFRAGDNAWTYDEIIKSMIQEGALDTMVRKDMVRMMRSDEQVKLLREKFLGKFDPSGSNQGVKAAGRETEEAIMAAAEASELFVRMSAMHGALISGMDLRTAAKSVAGAMVNYGDITTWEKQWAKRLAFFYTFPRKMLPKAGAHIMNDPAKGAALINALLKSSKDNVSTSEGRPELKIGDYRVNLGRMDPRVDAITAMASVADVFMPLLGNLGGEAHPRRFTGEGSADNPLGPSSLLNVAGWGSLFPTEDPMSSKSDWLEELTRSNWAFKMIAGDPILGSRDPNVEYSGLEKAARMVLPFRKVRQNQEEQMQVARIQAHKRRYDRELEIAKEEGAIGTAETLQIAVDRMDERIKELNKVIRTGERAARAKAFKESRGQ